MNPLLQKLIWLVLTATALASAQAQDKPRNGASQRYEVNQTFDGTSFLKDNNVWIYTKEFADTFGMPVVGIGAIQGAEAAAFRVEDTGYKLCGMGGKAENCMNNSRYILDVYIDERKTPLPWATDQKADWLGTYNSLFFLRTGDKYPEQRNGAMEIAPAGAMPYKDSRHVGGVRPYIDRKSKLEAFWLARLSHIEKTQPDRPSGLALAGYKRDAFAGLTLLTFGSFGSMTEKNLEATLRLVTNTSGELSSYPESQLIVLHTVKLPHIFNNLTLSAIEQKREQDQAFYRSLFPQPIGTNPNAKPFNFK
jgi:hypothetical protein